MSGRGSGGGAPDSRPWPGEPLLAVVGPTAVGKTALGIELALRLNGEVISADSMQVYRGMDIGTAKATVKERRGVPHHLLDVRDPDQPMTVAEYQGLAEEAIAAIRSRGRLPIIVGGTGLYVRAVVDQFVFTPMESDPDLRASLAEEAGREGVPALHRRLAEVDPEAAARIHPHDLRRIIRALEVYHQTGQPLSSLQRAEPRDPESVLLVGLTMDRAALYRRIEERVEQQLRDGLVEEVRGLLDRGYAPGVGPMGGLGYKEMSLYLRGEATLEEATALLKRDTRRYAKRQFTWFHADPRIVWYTISQDSDVLAIVPEIVNRVEGKWPG